MVQVKEIINGVEITETIDGNVVMKLMSHQSKPFIRTTNETDEETYQIIDKVGEIYNIPAIATDFVIIDVNGAVFIPADGLELIAYSYKIRAFRPDDESDIFHIGTIDTTSNSVTINLSGDGINWARISGSFYERYYPDTFNFTPVTTGQKILIIYAKPDAQVFHLSQGTEASEAVEPTYDGLFVARIIVDSAGEVVEEEDYGNKEFRDDNWRTINNATANFISIGNNRSGSFHLVNSADVLGFATKVGKYVWQGRDFVFYCDADTTFKNSTYTDTSELKHFTFFADYEVKAGNFAWFKEKNGELVQVSVGGGSDDTKLDKPLSPNNIATRVVNADNSTSDKGEFQQSEQIEIGTNTTAQASWRGKEIWVTASCTLTIPNPATLPAFWSIDIYVIAGTLTHAITSPATWLGTTPANAPADSFYRIVRRGSTNSFKVLGL